MIALANGRPAPKGYRWISCKEVKHWRSGKMIRRKDGLPFRFLVCDKR
ncbi:hypothetical protein KOR42_16020 [Thalassoglobus neptunius]|uniref:Uncharacterized protein n=1 Tax=Thalassoglobus neptunius TaxID=1938619 RepID=A0A5C5X7B0_9PLAN|nr:hypothetical protein [Thalassoglobus neptunius]TWT58231.1 hypothetical protein KOR42_16020 [Thalassoglobus neptunius]